MPVPGSLKRQPINPNEIARLLEAQFAIPILETLAYIQLVDKGNVAVDELAATLALSKTEAHDLLQNMKQRGLIIQTPESEEGFSALHPRMTLTNIFKLYEKELVQSLRDRRATVDRVVNLLSPIYEERKANG